jgi:hypothetical protein
MTAWRYQRYDDEGEGASRSETIQKLVLSDRMGAPPAQQSHEFLPLLQAVGWDVCVIATP